MTHRNTAPLIGTLMCAGGALVTAMCAAAMVEPSSPEALNAFAAGALFGALVLVAGLFVACSE